MARKFDMGAFARTMPSELTGAPRDIDTITREILHLKQDFAEATLGIGARLNEAKEMLPHGEWLAWLTEKVEFSERTARNFMRLANEWAANPQALADLGTTKAVLLLEVPAEEREQFIVEPHLVGGTEKTVADMSSRELQQVVRNREKAPANRQALADFKQDGQAQPNRQALADLESTEDRPVNPQAPADLSQEHDTPLPALQEPKAEAASALPPTELEEKFWHCIENTKEWMTESIKDNLPQEAMKFYGEFTGLIEAMQLLELIDEDQRMNLRDETWALVGAEGQLTTAGWMPGWKFPGKPCEVVADFDADGLVIRRLAYFDGGGFLWKQGGVSIDAAVIRWMALPPV